MLERIHYLPAERLDQNDYVTDFRDHWDQIDDVFWKLERGQTFSEPHNKSWLAWQHGSWDEAMRLIQDYLPTLADQARRDQQRGVHSRRLRIIEFPISSYLHWELSALRVRVEAGEYVRVLDAVRLGDAEAGGLLPELTILGTRVMYQVLYDDTGVGAGARKFVDQDAIGACRADMAQFWEQAEEHLPFLEREITPLPPPVPDRAG